MKEATATVWLIDCACVPPAPLLDMQSALSHTERHRMLGLPSDDRRHGYLCAHLALRQLADEVGGTVSGGRVYQASALGQPRFRSGPFASLSYSGSLALVAVCGEVAIGADLELRRGVLVPERWETRYPGLARFGDGMPAADPWHFARLWTRAEAAAKCLGQPVSRLIEDRRTDIQALRIASVDCEPGAVVSIALAAEGCFAIHRAEWNGAGFAAREPILATGPQVLGEKPSAAAP